MTTTDGPSYTDPDHVPLQSFTAGGALAILLKGFRETDGGTLLIDIEPVEIDGIIQPYFFITGRVSGIRLKVSVEDVTEV